MISVVFVGLGLAGCSSAEGVMARSPEVVAPSPAAPLQPSARARLLRYEVESELPGGATSKTVVTHAYDAAGRLVKTERGGVATSYGYDAAGRLVFEDTRTGQGTGTRTEHTYDANGRIARTCRFEDVGILAVMPNDGCTSFQRDAKGRVVREVTGPTDSGRASITSAPVDVVYTEDASGRLIQEVRMQGGREISVRRYERDAAGRVVVETFDALHAPGIEEKKTFVYDRAGEVARVTLERAGVAGEGTAEYEYEGGRVVRATGALPSGEVFVYSQHSVGRWFYEG
jgi:YD repeat-containing protein